MTVNNNPLEGLDVTLEDAEESLAKSTRLARRSGICVCGHSANAHTANVPPGYSKIHDQAKASHKPKCAPSRHICPCREYQEVLTTSDIRPFRKATSGPGPDHALVKGIMNAMQADREITVTWSPNLVCVKCKKGTDEVALAPVAYDFLWMEAKEPTDMNTMICRNCRDIVEYEWAGIEEHRRPDRT